MVIFVLVGSYALNTQAVNFPGNDMRVDAGLVLQHLSALRPPSRQPLACGTRRRCPSEPTRLSFKVLGVFKSDPQSLTVPAGGVAIQRSLAVGKVASIVFGRVQDKGFS